jgi:hypothetical protein
MAERQHESQEPELRGLLVAGAIISVTIALAIGVCLGLVHLFGGFARPLARAEHHPIPEPRLQPHPLGDRQRYDEQQRAKLSTYQWVDRRAGIVRIPIGRAVQIIAQQGGAAVPHAAAPAAAPAPAPTRRRAP